MTLGFKTKGPNGPTLFPEKILLPYDQEIQYAHPNLIPKIHTFREGDRWKAGMKIHMVTGNRTAKRLQFNCGIPELHTCISVQEAKIYCFEGRIMVELIYDHDRRFLDPAEILLFAANDGFNSVAELIHWFFPLGWRTPIEGQIIHWTTFRY